MKTLKVSLLLVGLCALAFGLSWLVIGPDSNSNQASSDSDVDESVVDVNLEQVPEYLAFETVFSAGEVFEVGDSDETEFLADDEDNELDSDFLAGNEQDLVPVDDDDDDEDDDDSQEDEESEDESDLEDSEPEELDFPSEFSEELEEELEDILDEYNLDFDEVNLSNVEAGVRTSLSEISGTIEPGIYVTPVETTDCSYELTRIAEDGSVQLIGSDSISDGRLIVNINGVEPDFFYSTPGCGEWSQWSQLAEPLSAIGNGDYWIGDLVAGAWQAGDGCIWERVSDFRGAQLADIVEAGTDQDQFAINDSLTGIRVRNCLNPSILVENSIPDELAFTDEVFEVSESGRITRR